MRLWNIPDDWEKANISPVFKKEGLRSNMPVSFIPGPRKLKEQILSEDIFRHTKVIWNSQLDLPEANHN